MKKNITLILVILLSIYYYNSYCGVFDKLNAYKYIITPPFEDKEKASEQNIMFYSDLKKNFIEKGIIVVEGEKDFTKELKDNPNIVLFFSLKIETTENGFRIKLSFKNYQEKIILEKSYNNNNLQIIYNEFISEIESYQYKYNPVTIQYNKEIKESEFDVLNGFKYIMISPIKSNNINQKEFYNELIKIFNSKGLKIETREFSYWVKELKEEPSQGTFLNVEISSGNNSFKTTISFSDIKDNIIYEKEYFEQANSTKQSKEVVLNKIKNELKEYKYIYDPNKNVKQEFNDVVSVSHEIEKIQNYFNKSKISQKGEGFELTPIEGIYVHKSYSEKAKYFYTDFTIAIIKSYKSSNDVELLKELNINENEVITNYKVIVIKSISKIWKPGEVRGDLFLIKQKKDIYSLIGKWYNDTKKISKIKAEVNTTKNTINIEDTYYEKIK